MPKIRGIKPDFWTDDAIVELSLPARLLFIGLWNYACDNGHLQDKPKQIKMRILPGDSVNVAELLRELEAAERIVRADDVITIPNFARHQKPDRRYFTTCNLTDCPEPSETVSQRESRRAHAVQPAGTRSAPAVRTPSAHVDGEVKGSDGDSDGDSERRAAGTPATKPKTRLPKNWKPTSDHLERAVAANLVLGAEVEKFKLHAETVDRRAANWNAAFTQWLIKAIEYADKDRPKPRALTPVADLELPPDGLSPAEYAEWDRRQRAKRSGA